MRYFTFLLILNCSLAFSCSSGTSNSQHFAASSTAAQPPTQEQPVASLIISNQKSRISDAWGSGQFLASRDKNHRKHNGLDIQAKPGDKVFMPFKGTITRRAFPYKDDSSYEGLVIKGKDAWDGYEVKIFYIQGTSTGEIREGMEIGTAQDLTLKYPGITNHIHVEVTKYGEQLDPFELWKMSF